MINRIREFFGYSIDRVAELASGRTYAYSIYHFALLMVLWGVWIALPFASLEQIAAYGPMTSIASSFFWGVAAIVIGLAKMHYIVVRRKINLSVMCLFGGFFWSIIGVSFVMATPPHPSAVVYLFLALYDFWLYKQLTR